VPAPNGRAERVCRDARPRSRLVRLGPADVMVPAGRRYLPGTMVLETTWSTGTGWAVARDVLLVGPWRHGSSRSETHRRVPADQSAERVLLRTVRCLQARIDIVLECEPAFDYGRTRGTWRHIGSGYGQAEVTAAEDGPLLRLTTDLNVGFEGREPPHGAACVPGASFLRPVVGRRNSARDLRRGSSTFGAHSRFLARVDQPRQVP
jgi:hypothetical protein